MLKAIALALTCAFMTFAQVQDGPSVTIGQLPNGKTATVLGFFPSATTNYFCTAQTVQPTYTASVAGGTMTNIVDSGTTATVNWTAHGLAVGNRVVVAGATDTDLNGAYIIATVPDANSFTYTSANVTDATYTTGVTVATTAPRTSAAIWSVVRMTFDGSGNLTAKQNSVRTSSTSLVCDDRATLAYN